MPELIPDWVLPPGAIIAAEMQARGDTTRGMSRGALFTAADIDAVLDARAPVTAEIAEWLENRWGTPASFWLRLEAMYRAHPNPPAGGNE